MDVIENLNFFVKIQKKKWGGGGFVKIQILWGGGDGLVGGGRSGYVNEELNFFVKIQKKIGGGGGGEGPGGRVGGGGGGGSGWM